MDEKKVKEAIELINHCIDIQEKCKMVTHANISAIDEDIKAYQVAIEALKKQISKKGIKEKIIGGYNSGLHNFYCPVCYKNKDFNNKNNIGKYCPNCGQRLDWSE